MFNRKSRTQRQIEGLADAIDELEKRIDRQKVTIRGLHWVINKNAQMLGGLLAAKNSAASSGAADQPALPDVVDPDALAPSAPADPIYVLCLDAYEARKAIEVAVGDTSRLRFASHQGDIAGRELGPVFKFGEPEPTLVNYARAMMRRPGAKWLKFEELADLCALQVAA